jgi:mRNA interferase MazF
MHNRGEIWLANLGVRAGTELGKTRPVLILQSQDLLNANHPSTLVIPLTTNLVSEAEPLRVRVPASKRLRRDSDLLVDQIRAIDNARLIEGPLTLLGSSAMRKVEAAVREVLDLFTSDPPGSE